MEFTILQTHYGHDPTTNGRHLMTFDARHRLRRIGQHTN